jgi:hypothetical protein
MTRWKVRVMASTPPPGARDTWGGSSPRWGTARDTWGGGSPRWGRARTTWGGGSPQMGDSPRHVGRWLSPGGGRLAPLGEAALPDEGRPATRGEVALPRWRTARDTWGGGSPARGERHPRMYQPLPGRTIAYPTSTSLLPARTEGSPAWSRHPPPRIRATPPLRARSRFPWDRWRPRRHLRRNRRNAGLCSFSPTEKAGPAAPSLPCRRGRQRSQGKKARGNSMSPFKCQGSSPPRSFAAKLGRQGGGVLSREAGEDRGGVR